MLPYFAKKESRAQLRNQWWLLYDKTQCLAEKKIPEQEKSNLGMAITPLKLNNLTKYNFKVSLENNKMISLIPPKNNNSVEITMSSFFEINISKEDAENIEIKWDAQDFLH